MNRKSMSSAKSKKELDASTEEKIRSAAQVVFYKKGFAATRTRDIAEAAGINLALLNYYFRSKQKLFELIILDTLSNFFKSIQTILSDEEKSLTLKVELIVNSYINFILSEPEVPTFIINELRNNPQLLIGKLPFKQLAKNPVFIKQHREALNNGQINEDNPLHFLLNILSLTIFPFMVRPLLVGSGSISDAVFVKMMEERKRLIPQWIKGMMILK